MQIRPEVVVIEGRASNLYLCISDSGLVLIDAGMPGDQKLLLAEIKKLGFRPDQLTHILITHADIDHAGSLAMLQEITSARVIAGAMSSRYLLSGKSPDHLPKLLQLFSRAFIRYRPVDEACLETVDDGDVVPLLGGLIALATPGHTPDHFSYYWPDKGILFAGDALHTRSDRLQRSQKLITVDEDAANASAIRLLELAPALFACGHGYPMDSHKSDEIMMLFNQLRGNSSVS